MTIIKAQPLKQFGISGPASAIDNEVPVFDGTTGKKIKAGSGFIITANLMQAADKALLLSGTTGGTPASGAGTRMMWIPAKGAFRAGQVTGTQWDNANIGCWSFAGGYNCKASASVSSVLTGYANEVSSEYSGILAGYINIIENEKSGILAGAENKIESKHSGIVAGNHNQILDPSVFNRSEYAGILTGYDNLISGAMYSAIVTGKNNEITGNFAGIVAGRWNKINGLSAGIVAGEYNYAHGDYSFSAGKYMQLSAAADKSFAFGYHTSAVALTQPNTFYIFPGGTAGKVAIGTTAPATSAIVDIVSTTGAFLPPRMTTAQKNALTPLGGMVLHDNTLNRTQTYEAGEWRSVGNIPGSAQGQLGYWDHTLKSWVHTETSELFWDDTNKRVGIGTTSPEQALSVSGMIHYKNPLHSRDVWIGTLGSPYQAWPGIWFGNAAPTITNYTLLGTELQTFFNAAQSSYFRVSNTGVMAITADKGVGIGATYASPLSPITPGINNLVIQGRLGLGTANIATSAILDLTSTTGAFLPPRMTEAQRDALTPLNGMILYNNSANQTQTYENGAWRQI